jgi:predicted phage tail protein
MAAANHGGAIGQLVIIDPSQPSAPRYSVYPPDVQIATPADGAVITAPVNVVGSVDSAGLVSWTLTAVPADVSPRKVLASGTNTIAGATLGQFDPTMLANGVYTLELSAVDVYGQTSEDDHKSASRGTSSSATSTCRSPT